MGWSDSMAGAVGLLGRVDCISGKGEILSLTVEPLPVLTIGMVSPYRSSFLVSESLDAWLF